MLSLGEDQGLPDSTDAPTGVCVEEVRRVREFLGVELGAALHELRVFGR